MLKSRSRRDEFWLRLMQKISDVFCYEFWTVTLYCDLQLVGTVLVATFLANHLWFVDFCFCVVQFLIDSLFYQSKYSPVIYNKIIVFVYLSLVEKSVAHQLTKIWNRNLTKNSLLFYSQVSWNHAKVQVSALVILCGPIKLIFKFLPSQPVMNMIRPPVIIINYLYISVDWFLIVYYKWMLNQV